MNIQLFINEVEFYRACKVAFQWTGSLKGVPELILDLIDEDLAKVGKPYRTLTIGPMNGYYVADPGDIVIIDDSHLPYYKYHINIIHNCKNLKEVEDEQSRKVFNPA